MSRNVLVSRRRGTAADAALWLFPVLVLLSVLLPLPLFILTGLTFLGLSVRARAGPESRPELRASALRPRNPRGPPL